MISRISSEIPPFLVMEVLEEAGRMDREGADVIHLEVGEPDFDTPRCVCEAAMEAIVRGMTHYTHSLGIPELREAVAARYARRYGTTVDPGQVIITTGTSPAMLMVFASILDPGDSVIMTNPHYACYPNFVRFLGGKCKFVELDEESGCQPDPAQVRKLIDPGVKAILINSPANPTGVVLSEAVMKELCGLGPLVISDEIYHGLNYSPWEHTARQFSGQSVLIDGFSKRYAMTGWRLGWIVAPDELVRPIQKMQQNFHISANAFVQAAGIKALEQCDPEVERMAKIYDRRRKFLLNGLREMGFRIPFDPMGAFYVLLNVRDRTGDSVEYAGRILRETRVAVTPGLDFGTRAQGFIRFSYANALKNIAEGLSRLSVFFTGERMEFPVENPDENQ